MKALIYCDLSFKDSSSDENIYTEEGKISRDLMFLIVIFENTWDSMYRLKIICLLEMERWKMTAVIEVENLQKKYGENIVLKDISFEVKKGEVFALLGTKAT